MACELWVYRDINVLKLPPYLCPFSSSLTLSKFLSYLLLSFLKIAFKYNVLRVKVHATNFATASGQQFRAHLGRKASADDSEVVFNYDYSFDEASGGYKLSVHWDGPSDRVFEDCIDFGKLFKEFKIVPQVKSIFYKHGKVL